ncbi:MAG TPA: AAA family ATPase [Longimicrobiaceae bacterium]|nr:AAA family ATPase [Longimicrobiaceae bacterium]
MTTPELPKRDWTVLLLGGNSASGKTRAAHALSRRLGVQVAQADTYRLAVQAVTTPEQHPAVHLFRTGAAKELPPHEAAERWADVARALYPALEMVVAYHLATTAPLILEGDIVLPRLASRRYLPFVPAGTGVRAVYVIEPDEELIHQRSLHRGRGYHGMTADEQRADSMRQRLHGEWLRAQAEEAGLPVLSPEPWDTLPDRILAAAASPAAAVPAAASPAA